jgi:hypothetical protein
MEGWTWLRQYQLIWLRGPGYNKLRWEHFGSRESGFAGWGESGFTGSCESGHPGSTQEGVDLALLIHFWSSDMLHLTAPICSMFSPTIWLSRDLFEVYYIECWEEWSESKIPDGDNADGADGDGAAGNGGGGGDRKRGWIECMQYKKSASFCYSILDMVILI